MDSSRWILTCNASGWRTIFNCLSSFGAHTGSRRKTSRLMPTYAAPLLHTRKPLLTHARADQVAEKCSGSPWKGQLELLRPRAIHSSLHTSMGQRRHRRVFRAHYTNTSFPLRMVREYSDERDGAIRFIPSVSIWSQRTLLVRRQGMPSDTSLLSLMTPYVSSE